MTSWRMTPIPVVVRNSLSQAPLWTTLVSPVTISTPASAAALAIDRAICRTRAIPNGPETYHFRPAPAAIPPYEHGRVYLEMERRRRRLSRTSLPRLVRRRSWSSRMTSCFSRVTSTVPIGRRRKPLSPSPSSFGSALIGVAIDEGHIASVDDPITRYLPELAGRPGLDQSDPALADDDVGAAIAHWGWRHPARGASTAATTSKVQERTKDAVDERLGEMRGAWDKLSWDKLRRCSRTGWGARCTP